MKNNNLYLIGLISLCMLTLSCKDKAVDYKNDSKDMNTHSEIEEISEAIDANIDSAKSLPDIDLNKYGINNSNVRPATSTEVEAFDKSDK